MTTDRRARFVALALAVVVGWVAVARAGAPDLEGQPIVAIELRCAAPIDDAGLRRLLPFKIGAPLVEAQLVEGRKRLIETELFASVTIAAEQRPAGAAVDIGLVRKPVINSIRFRGNDTLSTEELRRVIRLQEGMPLTDELRDYAVKRIHDRYVDEGFTAVQVSAAVTTRTPGEADVAFVITEGEPLRVERIDVEGSVPLAADEIRKASRIAQGDRYVRQRARDAEKAIVRLLRAQRYYDAEVDMAWTVEHDQRGVLRFTIDAGARYTIRFAGNHHFSDAHLLGLMDLPTRPVITDGTWRELARRARRAYQEDAYYFAKVDVAIESEPAKVVRLSVTEGDAFHVAAVHFDGNHGVSDGQLLATMATRPPSWIPWRRGVLLDDVLDDDLKRLWYLYRRRGFESAEIVDARTRFDRARDAIDLTVTIEEGRQTIVRHVERDRMELLGERLPALTVEVGQPLNPDAVESDRQALVTAWAKLGYTHAEVTSDVESARDGAVDAATVRFHAEPGLRQQIGTIIVQNNFDTQSKVILREVPFKRGEALDPDALLRAQGDVYNLGLFRTVTVRPLETEAQSPVRDVGISVTEKVPGSLQWGAGYNTRDGFRGFLEVGYLNLQGLGRRLTLRGDFNVDPSSGAPNEYIGNLGFREPHLADSKWVLRANLIAQRSTRSVDQFSIERFAFIPAIERTILPGLQAGLEFQYEDANVFDVKPDVLIFNPRDQGKLQTISLGPFLVYDGRDDAFVPRRGVYDSVRMRYAPGELGSDVPVFKVIAQHSHYVPLGDNLTWVYVVRGGWARALETGQQVPIRERFFLGGRTTVRGFGENDIGPLGAPIIDGYGRVINRGGDPLGGDFVINLNTELRFPFAFGLGGAVFVDGGGVYLQDRSIRFFDDFRRAAGLGLRYITPVGPISLDYGFKLDRRRGESIGEIHFSVGTIF